MAKKLDVKDAKKGYFNEKANFERGLILTKTLKTPLSNPHAIEIIKKVSFQSLKNQNSLRYCGKQLADNNYKYFMGFFKS